MYIELEEEHAFFLLPAFSLVLLYFDGIVHSTFRSKFLAIYYSSSTEKVHNERKEPIQFDTFVLALFLLQGQQFSESLFCLPFYRKMLQYHSTQQYCLVQFSFKLFWWNCKQETFWRLLTCINKVFLYWHCFGFYYRSIIFRMSLCFDRFLSRNWNGNSTRQCCCVRIDSHFFIYIIVNKRNFWQLLTCTQTSKMNWIIPLSTLREPDRLTRWFFKKILF